MQKQLRSKNGGAVYVKATETWEENMDLIWIY